jgi:hypothetical protein
MQRFCGATKGIRTKTPRAIRPSRTALAKIPSRPQSTVTKLVADGTGREAVLMRDPADAVAGRRDLRADLGQIRLVGQRGQRAGLSDPAHAEVVADLVEGADQVGMADGVADAETGHAVALGEGAHPDHAGVGRVDRRGDAVRGEVDIGLVEDEHCPRGDMGNRFGDGAAGCQLPIGLSGLAR